MKILIGVIVVLAALVLGVAWFATKGRDDDDDNDTHTEGW